VLGEHGADWKTALVSKLKEGRWYTIISIVAPSEECRRCFVLVVASSRWPLESRFRFERLSGGSRLIGDQVYLLMSEEELMEKSSSHVGRQIEHHWDSSDSDQRGGLRDPSVLHIYNVKPPAQPPRSFDFDLP
jgi:hypothetical protein